MGNFSTGGDEFDAGQRCVVSYCIDVRDYEILKWGISVLGETNLTRDDAVW